LYVCVVVFFCFFFSSRRRHTRCLSDWSSDVCSSDLSSFERHNARRLETAGSQRGWNRYLPGSRRPDEEPIGTALQDGVGASEERSEERRVGKECRTRRAAETKKKNK